MNILSSIGTVLIGTAVLLLIWQVAKLKNKVELIDTVTQKYNGHWADKNTEHKNKIAVVNAAQRRTEGEVARLAERVIPIEQDVYEIQVGLGIKEDEGGEILASLEEALSPKALAEKIDVDFTKTENIQNHSMYARTDTHLTDEGQKGAPGARTVYASVPPLKPATENTDYALGTGYLAAAMANNISVASAAALTSTPSSCDTTSSSSSSDTSSASCDSGGY